MSACLNEIELTGASFSWSNHLVLKDVSGGFASGSMTAIVGPNGAGKSTLLKGIIGIAGICSGKIHINGVKRHQLAWLPQAGELDCSFPITVLDMVAMGAWSRVGPWRRFSKTELERTYHALTLVGLNDLASRKVETLSGGQLQRVLFARLIQQDAPIMLLDEPFSFIDSFMIERLMSLLCKWHSKGRSIIVVMHDLDLVRTYFPQTLLLAGQVIAWGSTVEVLTPSNLQLARRLQAEPAK